jgi:aminoglycoside phosphotransferase (APT) family kinase protein
MVLESLGELGRARDNRVTWAAAGEGVGETIVKARFRDRAGAKTRWCARNLRLLADRGYPVPEYVWFGPLDPDWYLLVQRRLPGHPVKAPDEGLLRQLISLVELQARAGIDPGPRDMAGYHALVLFEGWDHFWRDAEAASPEARRVCARLTRVLRPVWGHRLGASDFAHGDLNFSNVLVEGLAITGVVDWDEFGLNSRAADLASILFDWHRVYLSDETGAGEGGAEELLRRIASIGGEAGLRCTVSFAAVTRLATAHRRGQPDALEVWATVVDRILDSIGAE